MRVGPVIVEEYYVENCRDGDDSYHFKLEVTEVLHRKQMLSLYIG